MRRLLLAALLLASALALGQDRNRRTMGRNQSDNGRVLLAYLPSIASNQECTGTSPTGTLGETLTFTRASSGFCTKTDGTLVLLTSDQPRIEPGGILIEAAATNLCIRSQELEDAAWTATNTTVTADSTVAPDLTTTAETLQSTVAGGLVESTAAAIVGAAAVTSVYVKTTAGTQASAIRIRNTTAGSDVCTGTITATTTWQLLKCSGLITTGNNHSVRIYAGGTAGTGTIIAWGAMLEVTGDGTAGIRTTSYIATEGTSVTRALETASLAIPSSASQAVGCVAVTMTNLSKADVANQRLVDFNSSNPIYVNNAISVAADDGSANPGNLTIASMYTNTNRVEYNWIGTTQYLDSASARGTNGVYDGSLWSASTLYLGAQTGTSSHINANLRNVKMGNKPGACL